MDVSGLLLELIKFNSTYILLIGEDFESTGDLLEQIVWDAVEKQDGELVSQGSGRLKIICDGVMQTPLGEPIGIFFEFLVMYKSNKHVVTTTEKRLHKLPYAT
jgi:hypothetical protein